MHPNIPALASTLYHLPCPAPSEFLPLFNIYNISAPDGVIFKKNTCHVIIRNMAGGEHTIAIGNDHFSSTLFLWMAKMYQVHHRRIILYAKTEFLTGDETMEQLAPLLEETERVIHVLVNDPVDDA